MHPDECLVFLLQRLERRFPVAIIQLVVLRLVQRVAQSHEAPDQRCVYPLHFVCRHAQAVLYLHEFPVIAHIVVAFLLRLRVEVELAHLRGLGGRLFRRAEYITRQPINRLRQQFCYRHILVGQDGILLAELSAFKCAFSQHHLWMLGEILIDEVISALDLDLFQPHPAVAFKRLAGHFLAQEQDVRHHFCSGVLLECRLRQADRAQQVGALGEVLPRLIALLVHGVAAGHKHHQPARLDLIHGLGEEVVMQREGMFLVARI